MENPFAAHAAEDGGNAGRVASVSLCAADRAVLGVDSILEFQQVDNVDRPGVFKNSLPISAGWTDTAFAVKGDEFLDRVRSFSHLQRS